MPLFRLVSVRPRAAFATFLLPALLFASIRPARADIVPPIENIPFVEVTSPAGPGSQVPALTAGPDRLWLTWIESPAGGVPALRLASYDGKTWSPASTVVSDSLLFVNWADFPRLLVLADRTLVLSYPRRSGPDPYSYDVKVTLSTDGGKSWTPAATPHKDGRKAEHGFVSLAPDPVEGFWIFWLDGRNHADAGHSKATTSPNTELRGALWRGGQFGEEVRLDPRVCDCCQTAAVRTLEGMAVAYRDRGAKEIRDISVVRYERRVWSEPFTVREDGWQIDGCPVNGPALAVQDRRMAMAWYTDAREVSEVFVALSDSSSFGLSRILKVDDGKPTGRVDVEFLPDGSALVAWIEQTGDATADLRARRVTLRGEMSPSKVLAPTTLSRAGGFPSLALKGIECWMAWTDSRTEPSQVRIGKLDMAE